VNQLPPIAWTLDQLAAGSLKSRDLTNACLARIADPAGEGSRTFTYVAADTAKISASFFDSHRASGALSGLPISIKDLFDVQDQVTAAGSVILADRDPSKTDAPVIARLRCAGAIIVGRTNMTEFAFSGLGLNPHYGTPSNLFDRAARRIPGGSSSGAAVSVTDGMAHAAIGTDTGGSVRIPAALCGLTGFKPTARRVPRDGAVPLSTSLDSIGPIAPTVACCARVDAVLAGEEFKPMQPHDVASLRLAVLQGYVLDDLETPVANAYTSSLTLLSSLGATLLDVQFTPLASIPYHNRMGGLSAPESYAWHHALLQRDGARYDPHVSARILRGQDMSAWEYLDLLQVRSTIIAQAAEAFQEFDAILLPTVPRIAPTIAELERSDDAYFSANGAMLRNPSIFNFLDGCALSIPCHMPGQAPVGLMIAGTSLQDRSILEVGAAIEDALRTAGHAVHGLAADLRTVAHA
jgi:aspartyl-tRNA(Asn)/glutamyl-tRNA(Gln) amidotransferase subunit A